MSEEQNLFSHSAVHAEGENQRFFLRLYAADSSFLCVSFQYFFIKNTAVRRAAASTFEYVALLQNNPEYLSHCNAVKNKCIIYFVQNSVKVFTEISGRFLPEKSLLGPVFDFSVNLWENILREALGFGNWYEYHAEGKPICK